MENFITDTMSIIVMYLPTILSVLTVLINIIKLKQIDYTTPLHNATSNINNKIDDLKETISELQVANEQLALENRRLAQENDQLISDINAKIDKQNEVLIELVQKNVDLNAKARAKYEQITNN